MKQKMKAQPREISGGPAVPEILWANIERPKSQTPKAQKISAASDVPGTFSWQFWYANKK